MELYNINPKNLVSELNSFETSKPNCLSLKELIQFLKFPRDMYFNVDDFSKEKLKTMKHALITDLPNVCLLSEEEINAMRNVFKEIDKTGDLMVSRKVLIRSLRKDYKLSQSLQNPAVYLTKFDKVLILDRVLHQIEREEYYGEEINRKAKENISWQHFIAHFLNYRRVFFISRELFHKLKKKADLKNVFDDQELLDLSPDHISLFKEIFEKLEKTAENYAYTPEILKKLRAHTKFEFLSQENARRASEKFCLPNETISEVLKRMEKEADDHLDWDEFLEFFTRRGRPKFFIIDKEERMRVYKKVLDKALPQQIHTKKFQTVKKKFLLDVEKDEDFLEEKDQEDVVVSMPKAKVKIIEHESDPENYSKKVKSRKMKERAYNKAKKVGFFGAIFKENIDRENFKVTIPHPFSFNEREKNKRKLIRQTKLEQSLIDKDNEELEILKIRFKAQGVPKNIKDHHLWDKISKRNDKRREEVKKHSKAMTLQNEKPFSFYFRDKNKKKRLPKKNKEEENFKFKANPIPWFSSVKILIDPETQEKKKERKNTKKCSN